MNQISSENTTRCLYDCLPSPLAHLEKENIINNNGRVLCKNIYKETFWYFGYSDQNGIIP